LGRALADNLQRGCDALGFTVTREQQRLLLLYLELLVKWNRTYNLTAIRDAGQMIPRHLLDSLVVGPLLKESRVMDVGTGAGLPGVPLAVVFPDREFHVLDSNGKKTRFLFQVKTALGLDNMTVHHARVERFSPERGFEAILSRAFASLRDMIAGCRHLLLPGGRFLAMKGVYPAEELAVIEDQCDVVAVHPLQVPGLAEQRHLVELTLRPGTGRAQS
jgi:16S rRNA (guanine527-N7)-methyltransferase